MTRTFIALEMNEAMQRHLEGVILQMARILPSVRWVDPASIHLTLAFLGELDDEQLAEAARITELSAQQVISFSYRLSRLGVFTSSRQPRVIWMGIEEPSGVLLHLHRVLNRELERCGFKVDKRAFSPHLTLARIKNSLPTDEQEQLQRVLTGKQQDIASTMVYQVRHIHLMKSELLKTGAHYTCLQEFLLK